MQYEIHSAPASEALDKCRHCVLETYQLPLTKFVIQINEYLVCIIEAFTIPETLQTWQLLH